MPVYNPVKPSLPKDEFRSYNKRKIFFISITTILLIGSSILLYFAFRPIKQNTNENTNQSQNQQQTTTSQSSTTSKNTEEKDQTDNQASGQKYKVESGDTLFTIGQKFNVDWHQIASANNLKEPYSLKVGQELIIPEGQSTENNSD